ncbi:MAG: hypothetical protein ABI396_18575, partial [Ktedonobacteraceae bacterium]
MQHPYDDEQSIPYQPEQGQVATHDQNASNAPTMPTIPASPPQQDYAGEYPIFSQQPAQDHSASYPNYPQQPAQDNPNGYPNYSQQPPRRTSGGVRAGAIFLLTLLLAVVFGVGLFSGWQYGRSGSVATAPTTGQLQS